MSTGPRLGTGIRIGCLAALAALGLGPVAGSAAAPPLISTAADQKAVAVTIYDESLALVRDQRHLSVPAGASTVALRDVCSTIDVTTALIRAPGMTVLGENYALDQLSADLLAKAYLGKTVTVIHPPAGPNKVEVREKAKLVALQPGIILQYADRVETVLDGRIVYPGLPPLLNPKPTLLADLESADGGAKDVELTYLATGLSWRVDYAIELTPAEDRMSLAGFVTIANNSGSAFMNARVRFVTGDVHRLPRQAPRAALQMIGNVTARSAAAPSADATSEESFGDFHLYTLNRPTTLALGSTRQATLFDPTDFAAQRAYETTLNPDASSRFDGGQRIPIASLLNFTNTATPGMPLPGGRVRVYKRDSTGALQFVGEDAIRHTPRGAAVRLTLGNAFDLNGVLRQTDFKKLGSDDHPIYEAAYEYTVHNSKSEPATVSVLAPIGTTQRLLTESQPHEQVSSAYSRWKLTVAPDSDAKLSYRFQDRR